MDNDGFLFSEHQSPMKAKSADAHELFIPWVRRPGLGVSQLEKQGKCGDFHAANLLSYASENKKPQSGHTLLK